MIEISTLKVESDDVIAMKIGPNDSVEDAVHTFNNLTEMFPNNRIVTIFLENDIEIKKEDK